MSRRSLSRLQRVRIFDAGGGICHFCETKINASRGELWDVSHVIPLEVGGKDELQNMRPAHRTCHRKHTAEVDAPLIAKTHRARAKHLGIRPKSKFACARDGKFKQKVGGAVVLRNSGDSA